MTGLVYLDIAIGVIFLVLVFSLFAGAIQEVIASIFNLRAKSLREGIRRMIGNDEEFKAFWNTPLIDGLKGPSSMIGRMFDTNSEKEKRNPSDIPVNAFTKSVLFRLRDELNVPPNQLPALLEAIRVEAAGENPRELVRRVAAAIEGVEDKAEAIEAAIGSWYSATRNRLAGWYVRRSQWILLLIGMILAVATNTDPIRYGYELRANDALREKVVIMAEEVAALEDLDDVLENLGVERVKPEGGDVVLKEVKTQVLQRVQQLTDKLDAIEANAGWSHCGEVELLPDCLLDTLNPRSALYEPEYHEAEARLYTADNYRHPLFGWLLLAFAVMLGAQFWLDTLRRFVSIRSAATGIFSQPAGDPPKGGKTP